MTLFFLLLLPYYTLARGLNTLRVFELSWSDLKSGKTGSNSPTSKLKYADIYDGVLLIVLSLVALVALSSLPLYEVGAPLGYKLISKTFLPGLFTGWALELLRCHSADCSFNGKQAIFLTLTIAILLGSLYWLWVEVSY